MPRAVAKRAVDRCRVQYPLRPRKDKGYEEPGAEARFTDYFLSGSRQALADRCPVLSDPRRAWPSGRNRSLDDARPQPMACLCRRRQGHAARAPGRANVLRCPSGLSRGHLS